jgi:membrane fusion protein (multidrug efflux system)
VLRPNQYVRTRLSGAIRPNAIPRPQRAVQQGAKGTLRLDRQQGPEGRVAPVVVGDWYGDSWFIAQGPRRRERVVVDGALRLAPDAPVKGYGYTPKPESPKLPRRRVRGQRSSSTSRRQGDARRRGGPALQSVVPSMKGRAESVSTSWASPIAPELRRPMSISRNAAPPPCATRCQEGIAR